MITCYINGMVGYPTANQSIKITYSNQYVSDSGEYSYDISFPMDIPANRHIFKNVSRFDVSKHLAKYEDCKLYVDGKNVINGVGTVISVSESEVKIQILGGKSRLKFNDKYAKHYIDEMDLGDAAEFWKIDLMHRFEKVPAEKVVGKFLAQFVIRDFYQATNFGQLGSEGMFVLTPTYDETNDLIANFVFGRNDGFRYITNVAVHPNLIYLLERILKEEGYAVKRNDFAKFPWNRLYVASAYKSFEFRKALPHWTAYTFIEEFRKLFNAHILFDEDKKTVSILQNSELMSQETVPLEPLDEYSVEYDEDGSLSTIDTSNIEYNLQDSANRQDNTVISQKVFEFFDLYVTKGMDPNYDLEIQKWDEKKKKTTIIQREDAGTEAGTHIISHYVWMTDEDGNNGSWKMCGELSPLIHDKDSDDTISLLLSPAATFVKKVDVKGPWETILGGVFSSGYEERPRIMLSVPNDREVSSKECSKDEEGYSYVAVEDAMSDESSMDTSEDDDECLPIYFLDDVMQDGVATLDSSCLCNNALAEHCMAWPIPVTDDNSYWRFLNLRKGWSLSLVQRANYGISEFHGEKHIDKNNSICVKFLSATIPDPSRIYMFRHKKYVCEKIEMDVSNDSLEPLYTGYFYMMT